MFDGKRELLGAGFQIAVLSELQSRQNQSENCETSELEHLARATEQALGEIFAHLAKLSNKPHLESALRQLGQALGVLIYINDAKDDLEKDKTNSNFNAIAQALPHRWETDYLQILEREKSRLFHALRQLSLPLADEETLASTLRGLAEKAQPPDTSNETGDRAARPLLRRRKQRGFAAECLTEICCHASGDVCCTSLCTSSSGSPVNCCINPYSTSTSSEVDPYFTATKVAKTGSTEAPLRANLLCPSCGSALNAQVYGEVEVDECHVCWGMWLDQGELEILCGSRHLPDRLLRQKPLALRTRPEGTRPCPHCSKTMLIREIRGTRIDFCEQCSGLWLDQGEFNRFLSE